MLKVVTVVVKREISRVRSRNIGVSLKAALVEGAISGPEAPCLWLWEDTLSVPASYQALKEPYFPLFSRRMVPRFVRIF